MKVVETLGGTSKDLEYLLIAVFAHFVQTLDYYLQTFFQMLFLHYYNSTLADHCNLTSITH